MEEILGENNSVVAATPETPPNAKRVLEMNLGVNEYMSPAFIKRARMSYGSLLADSLDPFEEDGGVKGKGRKRTRFGRDSSAWRYTSQSPSPEPGQNGDDIMVEVEAAPSPLSNRRHMADEGCQTNDLPLSPERGVDQNVDTQNEFLAPSTSHEAAVTADVDSSIQEHPVPIEDTQIGRNLDPSLPNGTTEASQLQEELGSVGFVPQPEASDSFTFARAPPMGFAAAPELINQDMGQYHEGSHTVPGIGVVEEHHSQPFSEEQRHEQYLEPYQNRHQMEESAHPENGMQHGYHPYEPHIHESAGAPMPPDLSEILDRKEPVPWTVPASTIYPPIATAGGWQAPVQAVSSPSQQQYHEEPIAEIPGGEAAVSEDDKGEGLDEMDAEDDAIQSRELFGDGDEDVEFVQEPISIAPFVPHHQEESGEERSEYGEGNEEADHELEEGDYDLREHDAPQDDDDGVPEDIPSESGEEREIFEDENDSSEASEADEEGEYEYEEEEEAAPPQAAQPQGPPVVIDLISDSEEEYEDESGPDDARSLSPHYDGNIEKPEYSGEDEMDVDEDEDEDEDGDDMVLPLLDAGSEPENGPTMSGGLPVDSTLESDGEASIDSVSKEDELMGHPESDAVHPEANTLSVERSSDFRSDASEPGLKMASMIVTEEVVDHEAMAQAAGSERRVSPGGMLADDEDDGHELSNSEPGVIQTNGPLGASSPSQAPSKQLTESEASAERHGEIETVTKVEIVEFEDARSEFSRNETITEIEIMEVEVQEFEDENIEDPPSENELGLDATSVANVMDATLDQIEVDDEQGHGLKNRDDGDGMDVGEEGRTQDFKPPPAPQTQSFEFRHVRQTEKVEKSQLDMIVPSNEDSQDVMPMLLNTRPGSDSSVGEPTEEDVACETEEVQPDKEHVEPLTPAKPPVKEVTEQLQPQDKLGSSLDQVIPSSQLTNQSVQPTEAIPSADDKAHVRRVGKRGHRKNQLSKSSDAAEQIEDDPNVQLARASLASRRSTRRAEPPPQETMRITRGRSRSFQKNDTPEVEDEGNSVQLAVAALKSPTKSQEYASETAPPVKRPTRGRPKKQVTPKVQSEDSSVQLAKAALESPTRSRDAITPPKRATRSRPKKDATPEAREADGDTSAQLALAALESPTRSQDVIKDGATSKRATRGRPKEDVSPEAKEKDEEDNSVLLARAAINSPSKSQEEDLSTPVKLELGKRRRIDVPDLAALNVLQSHPGQNVDVVGIVTSKPPEPRRSKGGPRGIMLEFNITDSSIAPTHVTTVQIFRPHKESLPIVSPSDVVILRQFQVTSMRGRGFGLRASDSSSWAVFESDRNDLLPQIRGPPVEVTDGEVRYVELLRRWFGLLDEKAEAKLAKANEKALEAGRE
jgi:hypothetical protein